jgi:hypothetical protein
MKDGERLDLRLKAVNKRARDDEEEEEEEEEEEGGSEDESHVDEVWQCLVLGSCRVSRSGACWPLVVMRCAGVSAVDLCGTIVKAVYGGGWPLTMARGCRQ